MLSKKMITDTEELEPEYLMERLESVLSDMFSPPSLLHRLSSCHDILFWSWETCPFSLEILVERSSAGHFTFFRQKWEELWKKISWIYQFIFSDIFYFKAIQLESNSHYLL